jgi:uncharacterized membrane protein
MRYARFAGRSVERIAALSDGVFAVAMTLLVLDLHAPAVEAIHGEADLGRALLGLAPRLLVYMMSFLTLGIFWIGQQTELSLLRSADRDLTWLHLAFLFAVTLMPFSTALVAEFMALRLALLVYWANIAMLGAAIYLILRSSVAHDLLREGTTVETIRALQRRIIIAQALYAAGAACAVIDPRLSFVVIGLVQLNFAFAPAFGVFGRI